MEQSSNSLSGIYTLLSQRIANQEINSPANKEYKTHFTEQDIDPELNFFNIKNTCYYHNDDQFNKTVKVDGKISIIHVNSRSLYANFHKIREYLSLVCG